MLTNCSLSGPELYVFGAVYVAQHDFANLLCQGRSYIMPDPVLYAIRTIILPTLAGVGFLLNIINIAALFTSAARIIPSATYLIGISISGTLWMVSSIWLSTVVRVQQLKDSDTFNQIWTHTAIPCAIVFSATFKCSIWFVLAFNIERYLLICHPLRAPRWCTQNRSRLISVAIVFIAIILSLESPLLQEILPCKRFLASLPGKASIRYFLHRRDALEPTTAEVVIFSTTMLTCYMVPMFILIFINVHLIRTVKRAHRKHALPEDENQESSSTIEAHKILLAILVTFLVCILPLIPAKVLYFVALRHVEILYLKPVRYYWALSDMLYFLFAALNLVIYFIASARYRRLCLEAVCGIQRRFRRTERSQPDRSGPKSKCASASATLLDICNYYEGNKMTI